MNRIFLWLFLSVLYTSASAQSSLTFNFIGNGFSHTGLGLKYTLDYSKTQVAAYGGIARGGFLTINDQTWSSTNGVAGISLNVLSDSVSNGVYFYYGLSAEVATHNYTARNNSNVQYTDVAMLVGPQLGVNVRLSKRLMINSEWGIRGGVNYGHKYHIIFNNNIFSRDFYVRENTVLIYVPTSIGLTYRFGRNRKHTSE